jgi:predicted nucleic acid-binding protein
VPAYYFDTSALVKRYHIEPGSDRVDRLFTDPASTFLTANITPAEITSALDRKCQEGALPRPALSRVLTAVARDLSAEFALIELSASHILQSQELILRHHLRTLDALHLAVLLTLRDLIPILVSTDIRLLDAAEREQVAVFNPTL